jgi:hypothetical protein
MKKFNDNVFLNEIASKGYTVNNTTDLFIIPNVTKKDLVYLKAVIHVLAYKIIFIHEVGKKFEILFS